MTYKFIEHRSDIIIEAKAKTFTSALEDLAKGMFTQMGCEDAEEVNKIEIKTKAPDTEELVVTFLSDIIAQCEINGFTPKKLEIKKFDEANNALETVLYGERKIPKNIIKAVTYHELRVEKAKDGWTIRVLFDI